MLVWKYIMQLQDHAVTLYKENGRYVSTLFQPVILNKQIFNPEIQVKFGLLLSTVNAELLILGITPA